jgi:hypothetical protein
MMSLAYLNFAFKKEEEKDAEEVCACDDCLDVLCRSRLTGPHAPRA